MGPVPHDRAQFVTPPSLRQTGRVNIQGRPRPARGRAGARLSHAAIALILIALPACTREVSAPTEESKSVPATIGEVSLATAKEIRALIDANKGNVVVVNFWATWCPPCVKEMPELAKFWRDYEGKGVTFLSFSADFADTKDKVVVPFMNSYEIPFPVRIMDVPNPDDLAKELPVQWDGALPATFIFAPDGTLAWSGIGESVTHDALVAKVSPLLPK